MSNLETQAKLAESNLSSIKNQMEQQKAQLDEAQVTGTEHDSGTALYFGNTCCPGEEERAYIVTAHRWGGHESICRIWCVCLLVHVMCSVASVLLRILQWRELPSASVQ